MCEACPQATLEDVEACQTAITNLKTEANDTSTVTEKHNREVQQLTSLAC